MKKQQGGFTLIELIAVIVVLGILAAVAVPQFVDLSDEAETAAVDGVAGAMASAMALNYAGCVAVSHAPTANKCVAIADCDEVGTILVGGIPTGYTVGSVAIATNGTSGTCTVTHTDSSKTANFTGIGAGN